MKNEQRTMNNEQGTKMTCLPLFFVLCSLFFLLTMFSSCDKAGSAAEIQNTASPFASYKDIPGVTAEEIAEVEAIIQQRSSFTYGMTPSSEAFNRDDGEVRGFTAFFTAWLSQLFGVPFKPGIYPWGDLINGLETGDIDFAGNLTASAERRKTFFMTDTIARRSMRYLRLADSRPLAEIAETRPLRYAFLNGTTTLDLVSPHFKDEYVSVFVDDYESAYRVLERGEVDAFIIEGPDEAAFDIYGNVVSSDFFPLIYTPVSLSTRNAALAPVISVVQKAMETPGTTRFLVGLYNKGHQEYLRHKLYTQFDEKERRYIQDHTVVPFAAETDNYPISFYSSQEKQWQGIAVDVLKEVEELTGLRFELANDKNAIWTDLLKMLEDGKASIVTELMHTDDRDGKFLWTDNAFMTDNPALISMSDHRNIKLNEVIYVKVGLVTDYAHTDLFSAWFPDHTNTVLFDSSSAAFNALERGEVDMVMTSGYELLNMIHYQERSGFKSNFVFDYPYKSTFGFNKDEAVLRSIVDKALRLIDLETISNQWMRKAYDYRAKVAEGRLPWLIGAAVLSLITLTLILTMFYRSRNLRKQIEAEEKIGEADERAQLMLEQAPLVVMLWDENLQILDCNREPIMVFGVSSKKEYMERFFELTPEFQPNGMASLELAKNAFSQAFETGYAHIEWWMNHSVTGEPIPFDVTSSHVKYKGKYVVITYALDMRERNAVLAKMREADERTKMMFDAMPLCSNFWTSEGTISDCNDEVVRLFDLKNKQEYIDRFADLSPKYQPDGKPSAETAAALVAKAFKEGYCRFEWMMQKFNGEPVPTEVFLIRLKHHDDYIVVAYFHDLRERNAAIAKMREADERAQILFDTAPLASFMADKNGNLIDCNQEILKMFGLPDKEFYLNIVLELQPEYQPNGKLSRMEIVKNNRIAFEKGYHRFEWAHLKQNGESLPTEVTLVRVRYMGEYAIAGYIRDLTEQKAKEQLAKEVMEKTVTLSAILDSASDLIYCKDLHSVHTECNKAMINFFNVPKDHLVGKDDTEAFGWSAEKAAVHMSADKKVFNEKQAVTVEEYIPATDGTLMLFETIKTPLIQDGEVTGLVGMARDITQRKAVEEEMNRQHSLMNTVNMAAAILLEPDTDGGVNAINRSMEMVCQKLGADRVYLWENVRKSKGESNYRQIYKWISPEYCIDNNLAEFSYENTLPFWNSLFSERKSLNGPIDTFPDAERNFLSQYNIQSILAVPLFFKGELWGFVSFDDCHSRRSFSKADEHILQSWGLLVIGAIQRGKIMLDLEYAADEAKRASSKAMKAYAETESALEAKSRFIANMNHEMRTPMNVIVGLTDLMLEESDVPGKAKETLHKINIAGTTLMGLISDILDISKVEAGKMSLMPVQYHVASMLNDIIALNSIRAEDKPVTFKLDINENLPESLFGDDLRVKQILNNLLSNAFKYTKKGVITLGVSCQREKSDATDGGSVWVSMFVSDTGIGIRRDDIKKLFTDYNQVDTKANRAIEGTGLGLSITKKLVELMGGEISVESEYGKGTTFRVRIPQGFVTDKPIGKETVKTLSSFRYSDERKKAQKKLTRPDLSYSRVLVVDDFPTNLDVAEGMLRKYKMQVDCVTSGQESIDLIAAGEPAYDAVFMDHMMPGMDGVEAAKAIRALGTQYAQNIPIIALTANAVTESEKMFLENGFNAFLPKPFNVMSLDSIVQRWIRKK